ncbi:hypothetical protein N8341_01520 [Flavobacteriaceae bacterium]|nr:hypothetical protein [Flavobacteriaceae bacterium]|tara:strand:- start:1474 stop:1926 length:453 start_codon:yes stop_codon:yes gene_type:complete
MKKILSFSVIGFLSTFVFAQVTDTKDKVGIGVSNPQTKLHINVPNVNSEILRLDNAGLRTTSFFNYSDGTYNNAGLQIKKNSSVGQFKFSNSNGDLMTILYNGNVGIGTIEPQGTLHINNSPMWSSYNYGANLLIDGNRNNSIAILDANP